MSGVQLSDSRHPRYLRVSYYFRNQWEANLRKGIFPRLTPATSQCISNSNWLMALFTYHTIGKHAYLGLFQNALSYIQSLKPSVPAFHVHDDNRKYTLSKTETFWTFAGKQTRLMKILQTKTSYATIA